ncbi:DUF2786 domain-containing protein [Iamia sp. SCSIO 61187]|uniref:DUF2786 domain-containing protein n=1 Tax=Iamia sp. SCSIO 61187 TaxID=2722752 RepID=UPI001C62C303|nr:DUF2786 domain-containing protein [Iamia sp. SCSIO 61187]QYG93938.1 DUF2786 domain-containing protein [Iamia sp. SCSIO 61187]
MSRRRKQQHRRPGPLGGRGPSRIGAERPPPSAAEVHQLLLMAARARPDQARMARAALAAAPAAVVVPVAEEVARETLVGLWASGWQPAEVVWQARRRRVAAGDAAVAAVRAGAADLDLARVHPAWRAQLDALGSPPAAAVVDVEALVELVSVLLALPPVEVLLPVPGRPDIPLAAVSAGAGSDGIDARVLEKVRALLAKAESTTFEAEAQAFTAKAHELMTRHSLEHVLVTAPEEHTDRPVARRFCIDDPYADARSHLLSAIAEACRGKAVLLGGLQMVTVVGFASDLAEVDVLFTSLLVQAQTALGQLARDSAPGSRERSRGFRSSFLRGFAQRIGDRLLSAGAATVADLDRSAGGALVPVLAQRRTAVDQHVAEMHPHLRTKRSAGPTDRLGWYAGREAADRADLPWERLGAG